MASMRVVLSALFWIFLVATSAVLFLVALAIWAITLPFDRRRKALHGFTSVWASLYTWLNPAWRVRVEGREKIAPDTAYVMVANHLSLLDILVMFRLFAHFKWVSKIENFRLPFIGWNMVLNDYVKLRRGDRSSVFQMIRACRRHLDQGSSVMIFPEGTRSNTGRLRSFKSGAFEIAQSARVPLLPIVLRGTSDALPKKGLVLQGQHDILIQCLDPIPYESFAEEDAEALTSRVHALFADEIARIDATR